MKIQINTDVNIENDTPLGAHVEAVLNAALSRFSDRVTGVNIYLSAIIGRVEHGDQYHCLMSAHIEGRRAIQASESASSLYQVIRGTTERLRRTINSGLGRIGDPQKTEKLPINSQQN
jgi:ribosome-associated translation inhibitor RaiA